MKSKINVEFPCGYKLNMECKIGFFEFGYSEMDEDKFKECPLHGKKCPPRGGKG